MSEPIGVSGQKLTGVMLAIVALFVAIGLFLLFGPKLVDTSDLESPAAPNQNESSTATPGEGD